MIDDIILDLTGKEQEYEDNDSECKCEDDDDDDYSTTSETDAIKLGSSSDGFRTSRDFAIRVVKWFNGGHPLTFCMPVSVMRDGKVADTERIPLSIPNGQQWRSLSLSIMHYSDFDGLTVGMSLDAEKRNGGLHRPVIEDVLTVEYSDDVLTISGKRYDGSAESVKIGIVDKAEVKGKKAPKWYLDDMNIPMDETVGHTILGGIHGIDWLHLIQEVQAVKTVKQTSLEEWL